VIPFHTITETKPRSIPYKIQRAIPKVRVNVNVKLISWALLRLQSLHTKGSILRVVKNPAINPIVSEFIIDFFLPIRTSYPF
jgi:hypothetical protein